MVCMVLVPFWSPSTSVRAPHSVERGSRHVNRESIADIRFLDFRDRSRCLINDAALLIERDGVDVNVSVDPPHRAWLSERGKQSASVVDDVQRE